MSSATETNPTADVPPEARRLPRTGDYAAGARIVLIVIGTLMAYVERLQALGHEY